MQVIGQQKLFTLDLAHDVIITSAGHYPSPILPSFISSIRVQETVHIAS